MTTPQRLVLALAGSSLLAVSSATAQATSNTWNTDAAGNWTDPLNWLGDNAYAEGADNTATFGNFIGADRTITLDAAITIGDITASDTTHNYTISGANTLTLDRTSGTPAIDVVTSRTLTIASDIAGSDGLQKTGAGRLILSGTNNSYSGTTTLSAGTLQGYYGGTSLTPVSPFGTSSILLNGGTLELIASGSINSTAETVTFGNNVNVGADATLYVNRVGGTSNNKTMGLGSLTIGANTLNVTAANVGFSAGFSAVTLTGNVTFNPSLTYATLVLGDITQSGGSHSLTKTGVGTLRLTGTNDYAGGTVLNGGTLSVNSNAALGAATSGIAVIGNTTLNSAAATHVDYPRAISLGAGTTLSLNNATGSTTATFSEAITGSGHLTVNGGSGFNAVALSNTGNDFTGDLTLNPAVNSSLRVSFNSIGDAGMISLGKNGYYRQVQYSGSSNLILNTRRLDLNSTFAGIYDGGGVNPINLFENIGAGTIKFNADMTVAAGRTGTFFFGGTNAGDNTYAGMIPNSSGGTLSIAKSGAGKWILSNDNTFAGGVTVNAGTLVLGGTNSYTGPTVLAANTTLEVSNLANGGGNSSIGASSGIPNNLRLSGGTTLRHTGATSSTTDRNLALLGSATIDSSGTGALTLGQTGVLLSPDYAENASAVWSTANQKKITGLADTSTLAVGMRVTGSGIAANTTITSIDSATQVTVNNNFSASGGGVVNFGYPTARTLTLTGGNTNDNIIAGNVQNSTAAGTGVLSLAKTGAGTWVLAGINTYTGPTAVTAGTLRVNNPSGSGTGTGLVTVSAGATLGGSGSIAGAVTINADGTLAAGNSIESLAVGALTLAAGAIFEQEIADASATGADLIHSYGDLNVLGAVTLNLSDVGAYAWQPGDKITLLSYSGGLSLDTGFAYADGNDGLLLDDETFAYDGADWVINYDDAEKGDNYAGDATGSLFVTMTVAVPEAGTAGLVVLGLLLLRRMRFSRS